jgi:prefoldin subunit 5
VSSLSSLRSELNYWNNQVNELNNKIIRLKRRRSDVEGVKNALRSVASANAGDVNNKLRLSGGKLDSAIDYSGQDGRLQAILSRKDERTLGSDSNLTSSDSELQRELNDVNRKITEAENALAAAKRKVSDLKAAIAAEERREREAARRK